MRWIVVVSFVSCATTRRDDTLVIKTPDCGGLLEPNEAGCVGSCATRGAITECVDGVISIRGADVQSVCGTLYDATCQQAAHLVAPTEVVSSQRV